MDIARFQVDIYIWKQITTSIKLTPFEFRSKYTLAISTITIPLTKAQSNSLLKLEVFRWPLDLCDPQIWGSGNSQEIKSKCAALLEAVGEVPQMVEQFLQRVEADLSDQKV